ncbi:MAG TPA: NrfD/PsrC family molybdoenzyme membrane anchor subunit [Gemmatimonadaceae bacterium]|nr:NrfD/PsrC family molybdoenzyme membrane anchor subunit [Gemmatimonadaceae bacterium]
MAASDLPDDGTLTTKLLAPTWTAAPAWRWLFLASGALTALFFVAMGVTFARGIGVWGNNIPVAWAYAITDFVWWIGIGHAGTFISAFLLLLNQRWRASINRLAEAMTLFALVNASLFPLLHLGRPWFFYWLIPYPATMGVWPNFKSSLPWDVAAISTYFTVSLLFWYLGLVPDLATARDRAPGRTRRRIYGVFALGWRGRAEEWRHYRVAYTLLAGLATPLVISVHSIVSLDFSIAQLPGWHSTIFPPYFVVGAIHSGFAMVLMLVLPVRRIFRLEQVITPTHLDRIAKLMLVTGTMLAYSYLCETFGAWYSGDPFERYTMLIARPLGPYAPLFWVMTAVNVLVPQLFWSARMRTSQLALFVAGVLIWAAMWLERFVIIVGSLNRDFLPSSWHLYAPTWVDWSLLAGSIGLFCFLFLAFLRWVPFVPISEVKRVRYELSRAADSAPESAERGAA